MTLRLSLDACFDQLATMLVICILKYEKQPAPRPQFCTFVPIKFSHLFSLFRGCPSVAVHHFYKQPVSLTSKRMLVTHNLRHVELAMEVIVNPPNDVPYLIEMFMLLCNDWQLKFHVFQPGPRAICVPAAAEAAAAAATAEAQINE